MVPRQKRVPGKGNLISHFVTVELQDGVVTAAENVWIGQKQDGEAYQHKSEGLISSNLKDGILKRTVFFAYDQSYKTTHTPLTRTPRKPVSKQEL